MMTTRNPDQTRAKLMQAAFEEIYQNGFQGMRVDDILERTGLKKGALYHHFSSKAEIGYAVIDEIIYGYMAQTWLEPLEKYDDPIAGLKAIIIRQSEELDEESLTCGCPLNNLAQEMSSQDESFRQRIEKIFSDWIDGLAKHLERGKKNHTVDPSVDTKQAATFLVVTIEGTVGLLKATRTPEILKGCWIGIEGFLDSLRPKDRA